MPNIFSGVATVFVNAFANFLSYALPLLAVAIFGLLVAIAAVNFLFGLFGYKFGVSEKFRENLRRKLKQSKKPFPFAIKSRKRDTGKQADAKSPWTNPAEWSATNQDMLFAVEQLDGDLDYFDTLHDKEFELLEMRENRRAFDPAGKFDDFDIDQLEDELARGFRPHAQSVTQYWGQSFSHLRSIDGLLDADSVSVDDKVVIFYHAAKLSKMKQQALAENQAEWAKQYGDGMPSQPVRFVA